MTPLTAVFQYRRYFASPESGGIRGGGGSTVLRGGPLYTNTVNTSRFVLSLNEKITNPHIIFYFILSIFKVQNDNKDISLYQYSMSN